jgi:hypothetical protein
MIRCAGQITRLSLRGRELLALRDRNLECRDERGELRWQRPLAPLGDRYAPRQLLVDGDAIAWTVDGEGFTGFDQQGAEIARHRIVERRCGGLALIESGFVVSLFGAGRHLQPCILQMAKSGEVRQTTVLPLPDPTVRTWICGDPPLVISGDRLLARFFDVSSGIGVAYGLDLATGAHLFTTPPHPTGQVASLGDGRFLIGAQGYGAFETWQLERDGAISRRWPGQGHYVIADEIHVIELENVMPSKMCFTTLVADGSVRRGPHLEGYYTSPPARLNDGSIVFWRDGALRSITESGELRLLLQTHAEVDHRTWPGDLVSDGERLWFAVNDADGSSLYLRGESK